MVRLFQLTLDPCTGTGGFYGPGNVVSGVLHVQVDAPSAFAYIQITFKGEGYCHWSVTSGSGDNQTTHYYTGKEEFFNVQVVVWRKENAPNQVLPTGTHNFPFQFTFPTDKVLPASFDRSRNTLGYIRYSVEAGISSGRKFDFVTNAQLPVLEIVPVATPILSSPVQYEEEKTVCCLCCASGPVVIKVDLPRTGFCVGESVPVIVNVENNSRREVRMEASIEEKITYIAHGGHRTFRTRSIAFVGLGQPIQPRNTRTWNTEQLAIASSTVPSQSSSAVLTVSYSFVVAGKIPWSLGSRQQIPIVIGNVQQTSSLSQPNVPPLNNTAEAYPVNIGFDVDPPPYY